MAGRVEAHGVPDRRKARGVIGRLKERGLLGEVAAEFVGTLILILFGVGVVAQVVGGGIGDHDSIAWAWGIGVTMGVYVAGRISGAHLNPAVTIALAAFKGSRGTRSRPTRWRRPPGRSWPRSSSASTTAKCSKRSTPG
ncbi:aquaporin [Streptosporangium lutulentum]